MTRDFIFFLQTGFIKGTNFTKNELLNNHTIKKKDETTAFSFSILFVPVFESFYQYFFFAFSCAEAATGRSEPSTRLAASATTGSARAFQTDMICCR